MTDTTLAWGQRCGADVTAFKVNNSKWRCNICNSEVEPL